MSNSLSPKRTINTNQHTMNRKKEPIVIMILRILLGCVFIFSGFTKAIDPVANCYQFNDYFLSFNMDFMQLFSMVFAYGLTIVELTLGIMMLFRIKMRLTSVVYLLFMCFFLLLTAWLALAEHLEVNYGYDFGVVKDCGCFGNLDIVKLPVWATYARNALLLLLLIAGMEKNADPKPDLFRSGVLAVGVAAALFVSGYTFEPPQSFRERMPRQHPLIHMDVADTPIPQFIHTSPDSTYTLYVFSFSCVSCINGLPALREYQDTAICDKVIGLAVNEDKDNAIHSYYDFNFPVVYVGNAMSRFTDTVPTLLYIRNNRIEFVVEGGVPSSWWFRKGYLENL